MINEDEECLEAEPEKRKEIMGEETKWHEKSYLLNLALYNDQSMAFYPATELSTKSLDLKIENI
jgi:hypothetical protein